MNELVIQFGYNVIQFGYNVVQFGYNLIQFGYNVVQFGYNLIQFGYNLIQFGYNVVQFGYNVVQLGYNVVQFDHSAKNTCKAEELGFFLEINIKPGRVDAFLYTHAFRESDEIIIFLYVFSTEQWRDANI